MIKKTKSPIQTNERTRGQHSVKPNTLRLLNSSELERVVGGDDDDDDDDRARSRS